MECRNILQGYQAAASYQILHWNKSECCSDTDMDCVDNHPDVKGPESNGQIHLALIQSCGFYQAEYLRKNQPSAMF